MMLLRHLFSIAALPIMVTVVIPTWLAALEWALIFPVANFIYIPILEEPQLKRRFGSDYVEYCRNVPRLIPRLRPWHSAD
jgi:protein-S-isoprenylcysteine O-methyltransferase Ste14